MTNATGRMGKFASSKDGLRVRVFENRSHVASRPQSGSRNSNWNYNRGTEHRRGNRIFDRYDFIDFERRSFTHSGASSSAENVQRLRASTRGAER